MVILKSIAKKEQINELSTLNSRKKVPSISNDNDYETIYTNDDSSTFSPILKDISINTSPEILREDKEMIRGNQQDDPMQFLERKGTPLQVRSRKTTSATSKRYPQLDFVKGDQKLVKISLIKENNSSADFKASNSLHNLPNKYMQKNCLCIINTSRKCIKEKFNAHNKLRLQRYGS